MVKSEMFSMRFTRMVGIAAVLSLGIACSSAGQSPPSDEGQGEDSPESPAPASNTEEGTPGSTTGSGDKTTPPAAPSGTNTSPPTAPTTPAQPPAPKPKSTMTFFVTSTGSGALGGNLGGLAGADKKCQDLATAVNGGDHTWHAYLSIAGTPAKGRIGTGPWTNQKGKVIAATVDALHDYAFIPANADLVDEKGAAIPKDLNAILTGTTHDGSPAPQTCNNWTATNNTQGRLGDAASDTSVILGSRWNDSVKNSTCTEQALKAAKGEGRLYCFAID